MKKLILSIACLTACMPLSTPEDDLTERDIVLTHDFEVISETVEVINENITVRSMRVSFGPTDLEQFSIHHVSKPGDSTPVVFPAPIGYGMNGYFVDPVEGGFINSFFGLGTKRKGLEWLVIDEPFDSLNPGDCELGIQDCSVMAVGGLEFRIESTIFAMSYLGWLDIEPVIAGYVGGGMTATAVVDRHPDLFSGMGLLGAAAYSAPGSDMQLYNEGSCAFLRSLPSFVTALPGGNFFADLLVGAIDTPDDVPVGNPILNIPPLHQGQTYAEATCDILSETVQDPNWVHADHVFCASTDSCVSFEYCDHGEMLRLGHAVRSYADVSMITDIVCAFGAGESTYVDNLDQFEGSIYARAPRRGMGGSVEDLLALPAFDDNDVTLIVSDRDEAGWLHAPNEDKYENFKPFYTWARDAYDSYQ